MSFLIKHVFFKRYNSLVICIIFSLISFFIEIHYSSVKGFFAASGSMFTLAGLFLSIKHSNIFHLKIGVDSKHAIITGAGVFGSNESKEAKEKLVKDVESDEKFGLCIILIGTVILGYGGYFISWCSKYFT